jgi:phosphopantetheinyl transferase
MPLVYQHNINECVKLGVWHIHESEAFFLNSVPLQQSIAHPKKRLQHLAGRFLLQALYPNFPYPLIQIADTKKPFLPNAEFHFSISHCALYAAAIVSTEYRVGVDIETISNRPEKIQFKFLTEVELQMVQHLVEAYDTLTHNEILTACWSIKETLFKWYGAGEVDFQEHLNIQQIVLNGNEGKALCIFNKNASISISVDFLFFNGNCLSWLATLPV